MLEENFFFDIIHHTSNFNIFDNKQTMIENVENELLKINEIYVTVLIIDKNLNCIYDFF